MHTIFLDWILSHKKAWNDINISIEEIVNRIVNPENPDFPYVAVHHIAPYGLGQIALHKVNGGYILNFEAGRTDSDKLLAYCHEFVDTPLFDLWQERYISFLRSK